MNHGPIILISFQCKFKRIVIDSYSPQQFNRWLISPCISRRLRTLTTLCTCLEEMSLIESSPALFFGIQSHVNPSKFPCPDNNHPCFLRIIALIISLPRDTLPFLILVSTLLKKAFLAETSNLRLITFTFSLSKLFERINWDAITVDLNLEDRACDDDSGCW